MDSLAPPPARPPGPQVVVYTTPGCGWCGRVKDLLRRKGVPFEEVDLAADADLREKVVRRSGRMTVPQVFVDGVPRGGYDDLVALERTGELDAVLGLA